MIKSKKSLEWLEPLRFSENEARQFHEAVNKATPRDILAKQIKLFEVARKLK